MILRLSDKEKTSLIAFIDHRIERLRRRKKNNQGSIDRLEELRNYITNDDDRAIVPIFVQREIQELRNADINSHESNCHCKRCDRKRITDLADHKYRDDNDPTKATGFDRTGRFVRTTMGTAWGIKKKKISKAEIKKLREKYKTIIENKSDA